MRNWLQTASTSLLPPAGEGGAQRRMRGAFRFNSQERPHLPFGHPLPHSLQQPRAPSPALRASSPAGGRGDSGQCCTVWDHADPPASRDPVPSPACGRRWRAAPDEGRFSLQQPRAPSPALRASSPAGGRGDSGQCCTVWDHADPPASRDPVPSPACGRRWRAAPDEGRFSLQQPRAPSPALRASSPAGGRGEGRHCPNRSDRAGPTASHEPFTPSSPRPPP